VSDIDPRRYLLSEADSRRIFRDQIVPEELAVAATQDNPVVVFVAGQPGAGKTQTTDDIKEQLDRRGGAVVVNSDYYKPYHPEYNRLLAEDDRTAAPYTSMDGRRWMAQAEEYLIAHRADTIIETTMRDPGDFIEPAKMFRDAGYRVEVAIMAVPEPLSRLGIVHRYHDQVQQLGHGRLTPRANHDASYRGVLDAAEVIDRERIVDVASVLRRGKEQVAVNYLHADGQWHWPDRSISQAVTAERTRSWTPQETQAFTTTIAKLRAEMGPDWHRELGEIATMAAPLRAATPKPAVAASDVQAPPRRAAMVRRKVEDRAHQPAPAPHRDAAHRRHEPRPPRPEGPTLR
jgi:UDP-N-acetylglucosamine kinase